MMTPFDKPPPWVRDAVFYQIFPDRFARSSRWGPPAGLEAWNAPPTLHGYKGGNLLGIVEKLDWLQDLGITAVYLNPVFQSGSNHRYHTHDYFTIDPLLGDNGAFQNLLDRCRDRGIRVVLDGVFNHSSRGFFRFHDVLENGPQSPWADWFVIKDWPLHPYDADKPANYEAWWGLKALPKFNTENAAVREYLMGVGEYWARVGIDGWRLDVPQEIQTDGFWEEFRQRTKTVNPELYIVGEIWGDASDYIARGDRFDGAMNYLFTTAVLSFALGRRFNTDIHIDASTYDVTPGIDAGLYADRIDWLLGLYPDSANLAQLNLLDSHDTARILTLARGDVDAVVLAAVLLLTYPGAPCVYYGTEVGLPGAKDPDSRRAFPWDKPDDWDTDLLDAFTSLIALRHAHPALRSIDYRRVWPAPGETGPMLAIFERSAGDEVLLVAVNAGDEAEAASLAKPDRAGADFTPLWGKGSIKVAENHDRLVMPARSAGIWLVGV